MSKPIIVVSCISSKQGWGVANTLLDTGKYHVKAIARRMDEPKIKKLAAKGAEVVIADLMNKDQLKKAFKGALGLYAMTPKTGDQLTMGKMQADAAHEEGIKHVIWSGLENVEEITKGELKLPGFTMKAKVEEYMRNLPNRSFTLTSVYLGNFYTNVIEYWPPTRNPDGSLVFKLPVNGDTKLPHHDPVTSVGPVVLAILSNPGKYADKVIPVVSEEISPNEKVALFTKVTGIPATFKTAPREGFEGWEIFYFAEKYGYYKKDRDLQESRRISGQNVRTWESFLKDTKWKGEPWNEFIKRNEEYA
jgi:uncharacterized protein YbjT (DUF2867 family)